MTITVQLPDTLGALARTLAKRRNQTLDAYVQALVRDDAETLAFDTTNATVTTVIEHIRATAKQLPPLRTPVGNPATLLEPRSTNKDQDDWKEFQKALDALTQENKAAERADHEKRLA